MKEVSRFLAAALVCSLFAGGDLASGAVIRGGGGSSSDVTRWEKKRQRGLKRGDRTGNGNQAGKHRSLGKKGRSKKKKKTKKNLRTLESCGEVVLEDSLLGRDLLCDCASTDVSEELGSPVPFGAGLVLVGPATLDLNGRTFACQSNDYVPDPFTNIGVLVVGENASLTNGVLSGGNLGVVLNPKLSNPPGGYGGHTVEHLTITLTGFDGLATASSHNTIRENHFSGNGLGPDGDNSGDAITVKLGEHNKVIRNYIEDFGDDGIDVDTSYNLVQDNEIVWDFRAPGRPGSGEGNEAEDGIVIRGFYNRILNNRITGVFKDGIDIKYNNDTLDANGACFDPTGGFNQIKGNRIKNTHDGRGMKVESDHNDVRFNWILDTENNRAIKVA